MKRALLLVACLGVLASCQKNTCPAYGDGQFHKPNEGKRHHAQTGLFPKKMMRNR
jgi:hypothetical protein